MTEAGTLRRRMQRIGRFLATILLTLSVAALATLLFRSCEGEPSEEVKITRATRIAQEMTERMQSLSEALSSPAGSPFEESLMSPESIDISVNLDPWGTPYKVILGKTKGSFSVMSAGPDRKFGTEDDIGDRPE